MKTDIKKISETKIELKIKIPAEEFNSFIEKAAKKLGQDLEIKGFRKGKTPKKIVEKEVGQDKILAEAANLAVQEKYSSIVSEKNIEPIGSPKVEILKMAPSNSFEFKIEVETLPEIDLPEYKKIISGIKMKKVSVSEKEMEDALKWLQNSRANFTPLKRAAKKGDFVEIEYESPQVDFSQHKKRLKKALEEQKGTSQKEDSNKIEDGFLLGKGYFIPGFEEKLIGMKKGEEKEFSLTFPKKFYRKDLAGKKANFKVKMKKVKKRELPELNDQFASDMGKFSNLKSLKNNIKQGLTQEKKLKEKQRVRGEILNKIAEKIDFQIPEKLIGFEKKRLFNNLKKQITQNNQISFKDYLSSIKKTEQELRDSLGKEAQKRVRNFLILRAVGKKEEIEVTQDETKQQVNQTLRKYSPEQREKVDVPQLREYTKGAIFNEKVFQKLESFITNQDS